jgi:hypothetical protein
LSDSRPQGDRSDNEFSGYTNKARMAGYSANHCCFYIDVAYLSLDKIVTGYTKERTSE